MSFSESHFVSLMLDSKTTAKTFDPDIEISSADTSGIASKYGLALKQIILGVDAEKDDVNVVQVEAPGAGGDMIKAPIAILEHGKTWTATLDFTFPDAPVVFKLIAGKGPVYVQGNAFQQVEEDGEDQMEEEDDDEEMSEGEQEHMRLLNEKLMKTMGKKRKPAAEANGAEDGAGDGPKNGKVPKLEEAEKKKSPKKAK